MKRVKEGIITSLFFSLHQTASLHLGKVVKWRVFPQLRQLVKALTCYQRMCSETVMQKEHDQKEEEKENTKKKKPCDDKNS